MGRKKSKFVASETVPAGSTFDFVSSNVNYRITLENLKNQLTPALDYTSYAAVYIKSSGQVTTTISVAGTGVVIAGAWVYGAASNFTQTTGGKLTYTGETTIVVPVTLSAVIEKTASTDTITLSIAKNGASVVQSEMTEVVDKSGGEMMTTTWLISMATGDYVEPMIINETSTDDIDVVLAVFRAG